MRGLKLWKLLGSFWPVCGVNSQTFVPVAGCVASGGTSMIVA